MDKGRPERTKSGTPVMLTLSKLAVAGVWFCELAANPMRTVCGMLMVAVEPTWVHVEPSGEV